MQALPKVAVTQQELTVIKGGVSNTLWEFSHPEAYDFAPDVANKVLELAHKWFKEIATVEPGTFQGTLSKPLFVTEKERTLIRSVMKVLEVTVEFSRTYSVTDLFFACCPKMRNPPRLNLIPKGLYQSVRNKSNSLPQRHSVTLTWNPNNRFILQARKPPVLQASKAAAAYAKELIETKVPCDFTIQVDDESFEVHKFQLASHSQYFLKLFSNDMREARTDVLKLEGHKPDTVAALIQYIYSSGTLDENATVDELLALAALADGVEASSCLSACEAALSTHLKTNFREIYELAVTHNLRDLLSYCLRYADSEEELSIIRKSFKQENIALFYELADEHSILRIQNELKGWRMYNEAAQNLEIVVEKCDESDLDID